MSAHALYTETAIWNNLLGGLQDKETWCSPEKIKVENVSLGLRREMVLHVDTMFVQGLPFPICIATRL